MKTIALLLLALLTAAPSCTPVDAQITIDKEDLIDPKNPTPEQQDIIDKINQEPVPLQYGKDLDDKQATPKIMEILTFAATLCSVGSSKDQPVVSRACLREAATCLADIGETIVVGDVINCTDQFFKETR